jgi:hypothetical protein
MCIVIKFTYFMKIFSYDLILQNITSCNKFEIQSLIFNIYSYKVL